MYSGCVQACKKIPLSLKVTQASGDLPTQQITFTLENKVYLKCTEALLYSARYKCRALGKLCHRVVVV